MLSIQTALLVVFTANRFTLRMVTFPFILLTVNSNSCGFVFHCYNEATPAVAYEGRVGIHELGFNGTPATTCGPDGAGSSGLVNHVRCIAFPHIWVIRWL